MKDVLLAVGASIATIIGVWIKNKFEKPKLSAEARKIDAEANNINVTGEKNGIQLAVELYEKYALLVKKDNDELRKEFTARLEKQSEQHTKELEELNNKIIKLQEEKEELARTAGKEKTKLERRIQDLEDELKKYRDMGSSIKEAAHSVVEDVANKIMGSENLK